MVQILNFFCTSGIESSEKTSDDDEYKFANLPRELVSIYKFSEDEAIVHEIANGSAKSEGCVSGFFWIA